MDSADKDKFETAKNELHNLLLKPQLQNIPLLVLGNKNDLAESLTVEQVIEILYVAALITMTYYYRNCILM